jgi:hypothetical protein
MPDLPKSLQPATLLDRQMPGDATLGEVRAYILTFEEVKKLANSTNGKLSIRFLDQRGDEWSEETPLRTFQKESQKGNATIAISDGSGGMRVAQDA